MAARTEQIRHDIEETRFRMGETIEALRDKADVSARAQDSLSHATQVAKVMLGDVRGEVTHAAESGVHQASALAHLAGDRVEQLRRSGTSSASLSNDEGSLVKRLSVGLAAFGLAAYALGSRDRKRD